MFETIKKLWMKLWMIPYYSALAVGAYYVYAVASDNMISPTVMVETPSMEFDYIDQWPLTLAVSSQAAELNIFAMAPGIGDPSINDEIPYVYGIMRLPARRDAVAIELAAEAYEAIEEARLAIIFDAKEVTCLATAMYHEARGEALEGKAAVAWAVVNRRDQTSWPDTICRVVYQKGRNSEGVMIGQFAWSVDNPRIHEREAYEVVHAIAKDLYHNYTTMVDPTGGSQYFLSEGIYPRWVRGFEETLDIGGHKFYRDNRIATLSTKG